MEPLAQSPRQVVEALAGARPMPAFSRVLMADPCHFRVESAINPWMAEQGRLHVVAPAVARRQWEALRDAYESIGIGVEVIEGPPELPDFCFSANQSLAFPGENGRSHALLSRMASPTRVDEVEWFRRWYETHEFIIHELPEEIRPFEGTGDAIWHKGRRLLWGGVGPRTTAGAWEAAAALIDAPVIPLRLVREHYYHLDTCFCTLDEQTVLWFPEAFDDASRALVEAGFARRIAVSAQEAGNFACNAHCPDGRHVLLQRGSARTVQALAQAGFQAVELETGEFMKSGGSVFCLKQELP